MSDSTNQISQLKLELESRKTVEEKLRAAIVDGEQKQKQSQTELEANLTKKIKQLDKQNDEYLSQIN